MRCAGACCNSDNKGKTLRLHTFPTDSVPRNLWIISCCRQDNFNCNTARICSKHFKTEDFQRNLQQELLNYESKKGPKLKPEIVPTLYLPKSKSVTLSAIQKKRVQRAEHRESKKIVEQLLTTSGSTTQLQVRAQEEHCSQGDIQDVPSTSKSIGLHIEDKTWKPEELNLQQQQQGLYAFRKLPQATYPLRRIQPTPWVPATTPASM
ncbi:uncharacterized protein LOC126891210 [Diabrotica virgifera virgifera]|uniref:THAP-type domain-containing protein n=1 Tax=Diabrotica virgifera virgifera TaxID=50390 RepID=A0ABM5L1N7_DIAVI|nr:uncharacterized protein LOC126891210 [Diabrotica virgifera virgifera]